MSRSPSNWVATILADGGPATPPTGNKRQAKLGRLSAVVERSKEAVLITGVDGTIAYANPAFAEITGYYPRASRGKKPALPQIRQAGCPSFTRDLWDTILAGKIWHGEMTNRRQDGSLYVQETTIIPVQDERVRPTTSSP